MEGALLLNALDAGDVDVKVKRFDAAECVRRSVDKVKALASEKALALQADIGTDEVVVVADEEKLEGIWESLVDNAVKFTATGAVSVRVGYGPDNQALEVEIADTGPGMDPEEVVRVMEGLSQADSSPRRRFRGLGIGLRIADRLTQLLGGTLQMQSARGCGTRVTVTIPSHHGAANLSLH